MNNFKIDLNKEYPDLENCEVTAFLHEGNNELPLFPRRALVVVGGGGYSFVSDRESEPIALEFFNRGYNCFFIKYSISPSRYPSSLLQVSSLIDHIKKHAKDYSVAKEKVFAVGFSAGGHLVGSVVSAKCNENRLEKSLAEKIKKLDSSLTGIIMSYAVTNIKGHRESFFNLLGDNAENLLKNELSYLELTSSVTKNNPPAFIWCTADDNCVNASSSLEYALALNANNVPYALHIYPKGLHGLSLADDRIFSMPVSIDPNIKTWLDNADIFMQNI